jgi:hypothetical protein
VGGSSRVRVRLLVATLVVTLVGGLIELAAGASASAGCGAYGTCEATVVLRAGSSLTDADAVRAEFEHYGDSASKVWLQRWRLPTAPMPSLSGPRYTFDVSSSHEDPSDLPVHDPRVQLVIEPL